MNAAGKSAFFICAALFQGTSAALAARGPRAWSYGIGSQKLLDASGEAPYHTMDPIGPARNGLSAH